MHAKKLIARHGLLDAEATVRYAVRRWDSLRCDGHHQEMGLAPTIFGVWRYHESLVADARVDARARAQRTPLGGLACPAPRRGDTQPGSKPRSPPPALPLAEIRRAENEWRMNWPVDVPGISPGAPTWNEGDRNLVAQIIRKWPDPVAHQGILLAYIMACARRGVIPNLPDAVASENKAENWSKAGNALVTFMSWMRQHPHETPTDPLLVRVIRLLDNLVPEPVTDTDNDPAATLDGIADLTIPSSGRAFDFGGDP